MQLENPEQRNAMLAAIIDSSEDAIISKDLSSRVTSWNKAAERMFGYTEKEMIGQLIHILIPDDRKWEEENIVASLKRGERVEHFETLRRTKDGRQLNISLTISPIKDSTGAVIGASKIARDITYQKESEERLRLINEVGKAISAELSIDNILQLVTDATTRLAGAAFGAFFYNKIDAGGETYMLYALSGAPREAFEKFGMPRNTAVFAPTFEGKGTIRSDDITKDPRYGHNNPHYGMPKGHLPVVSYLAVPICSQSGIAIGGLFFGHPKPGMFNQDHENLVSAIASHAAVALDNAKLYQEISLLNSKKDEFIGFASHELKTPLTTIKSYLQLGEATGTLQQVYPKIAKQLVRLENLIDDLLDVSRMRAGKEKYQFDKVSLHQLIRESVESVDLSNHILDIDQPVDDILVTIDYQKILQVLVNLLSNAIKYTPPTTAISISVAQLGEEIRIGVKDEGPGIPSSELGQIFNQYYRISSSAKSAKGMGLGLYIAKTIMETHLGRIWVESEIKKGSTFYISFPANGNARARNTSSKEIY